MSKRPALLFYCQHAMGMGHLVRSLALAASLADRFSVVLLNGGLMPSGIKLPEQLEVINLPPLGLDNGRLVSRDGSDLGQAKRDRQELILKSFQSLRPEVLLVELFPFGRKKFEFELLPLLEESRKQIAGRPLVACSLRDILVSRRSDQEKYEERAVTIANRYFDLILVHSDPTFARLEESLRASARLLPAVHYTGFVVGQRPEPNHTTSAPRGPILVSAGGGLYGAPLFNTAIAAHALLTKTEKAKLKVVAGPFLPDREWEALRAAARQGIQLTRSVPDLFEELRRASASISQCGYNTALEIVQAGVPALVVPFADGGEDEQMKRARRLEQLGAVRVLDQNEMTHQRMADEMRALLNFQPRAPQLELNGAQRSAEILDGLMRARHIAAMQPQQTKEISGWQI